MDRRTAIPQLGYANETDVFLQSIRRCRKRRDPIPSSQCISSFDRWKGCVIKLIYIDFLVFISAYTIVSCIYRFALNPQQQKQFEGVVLYVFDFQQMIPISFILGFYVQLVFSRFWQQFNSIPWVFTPTLAVVGAIQGEGRARAIRRTCVRYMNASLIIASSRLHVTAKKRFPTTQHLIQAGEFK